MGFIEDGNDGSKQVYGILLFNHYLEFKIIKSPPQ